MPRGLELRMFFRGYFFIIEKTIDKSPSQIMFRATVGHSGRKKVSNLWSGHKLGRENHRFWTYIG